MPDSAAVRMRRHRLHKAGDHSMCRRECGQIRRVAPASAGIPQVPAASGDFDARQKLLELAIWQRDAYAADPSNAILAREYRLTLLELAKGSEEDGKDPFAELLAELTGPVPAEVGDSTV